MGRMERENGNRGRNFMARRYFIRRLKFRARGGEVRKRKYRSLELRFQRIFRRERVFYSVVYLYLLVRFSRHFTSLREIYTSRKNYVTVDILITQKDFDPNLKLKLCEV